MARIKSPNHARHVPGAQIPGWGMIPLEFETPDPDELRLLFAELGPEHRQCGLDDEVRAWFADERFRVATRVTAAGSLPQARQFCKGGCPAGARGALWQNALGAEPSETVPISIFLFSLLFTCSYFMNCRSFFAVASLCHLRVLTVSLCVRFCAAGRGVL